MVSTKRALQAAAVFTGMAFALMFSSGTASADTVPDSDRAQTTAVAENGARDIGLGIGLGISTGHHWNHWDDNDWDDDDWDDWDGGWHHGHHHGLLDGISIGVGVGLIIG